MHATVTIVAHAAAMGTLVCIMVGVGLSLPEPLSALRRRLTRAVIERSLWLNFLWVPACALGLAMMTRGSSRSLATALLLFGCLPAGPISLLFVSRRPTHLARSTAVILLLQVLSVALAPPLLVGCCALVLGESPFGQADAALGSLAAQMSLLELLPLALGAALATRLTRRAVVWARMVRRAASSLLVVSAVGFAYLFREQITEGQWLQGLGPFVGLSLAAWLGAAGWPGATARADAAQIAALRNISLALVLSSTTPGAHGSVVFVLVGAAVTTVFAPALRFLLRLRMGRQTAQAG